jgi:hypothetical protein
LLRVRVSVEEMKIFRAKAKRSGLLFPKWIRRTLTDAQ